VLQDDAGLSASFPHQALVFDHPGIGQELLSDTTRTALVSAVSEGAEIDQAECQMRSSPEAGGRLRLF